MIKHLSDIGRNFYIYTIILFIFSISSFGQCLNSTQAFNVGEELTYDAFYNWGFIWMDVGDVSFKVNETTYRDKYYLNFISNGSSSPKHDWMFKVRDTFNVIVEPHTLRPVKFNRSTHEGGYSVNNTYVFNHNRNKIYSFTQNSKKPYTQDTLELPNCGVDVLTAIYYLRNIDLTGYSAGDTIPVTMVIDNELFDLYVRFHGKEIVKSKSGLKYRCNKVSALLVEGTMFKGGEELTAWVTDDENKVPILVQAKILVGSVKAILVEAKNLRHPKACLVEE